MKFTKKVLADIKRCYSVSKIKYDNKEHLVFASEDPNIGCESFNLPDLDFDQEVWKTPGGCMSMIQIPNRKNQFLAIHEFYLKVHPSLANLALIEKKADGFHIEKILDLPFLHRFDVFEYQNKVYVILSVIAEDKQHKEDWSKPGQVYAGILEEDNTISHFTKIGDNMFHNHGFYHYEDEKGGIHCYFGSDEGLFVLDINDSEITNWKLNKIIDGQIGEVAVIDIDNDGDLEIMTIEAFHGNNIYIYKLVDGKYQRIYHYDNKIAFAHALSAGVINGKNTFVAGVRREDCELFTVQYIDGKLKTEVIDTQVGPANLIVVDNMIASANHTANQACIYEFEK